jgi:rhamnogalacturonan endolyase
VRPIAILTADGVYFQDNSLDPDSYQYWSDIESDRSFTISRVKEGKYRLTVYTEGVFSDYIHNRITMRANKQHVIYDTWKEESTGTEVWRLGIPDKSSGEFRHDNTRDVTHPLQPPEYLIYWGVYN